jgi:hypothetical protein
MVRRVGFTNPEAVKAYIIDRLSRKYLVSPQAMRIRLQRWPIDALKKIDTAMTEELDFLE